MIAVKDSKCITGGFYSYHHNINILELVDTIIIVLRLNGHYVQYTVKSINKTHTFSRKCIQGDTHAFINSLYLRVYL